MADGRARRSVGHNGARTAAAIRRIGLQLIYRHGFEAMTLRDLAAKVGIQPASLYNHIRTKQDLLFELIREHLQTLLAETDAALAKAAASPTDRLRAFVEHHVIYHLTRKQEVFVANFELRALKPANYAQIIAMRRTYEGRLIAILESGLASGAFKIDDTHVTAYAILALLTGGCTWYKPEGRLSREEIVALHTRMVLRSCLGSVGTESGDGRTGAIPAASGLEPGGKR